jgi:hypothetical protein
MMLGDHLTSRNDAGGVASQVMVFLQNMQCTASAPPADRSTAKMRRHHPPPHLPRYGERVAGAFFGGSREGSQPVALKEHGTV